MCSVIGSLIATVGLVIAVLAWRLPVTPVAASSEASPSASPVALESSPTGAAKSRPTPTVVRTTRPAVEAPSPGPIASPDKANAPGSVTIGSVSSENQSGGVTAGYVGEVNQAPPK